MLFLSVYLQLEAITDHRSQIDSWLVNKRRKEKNFARKKRLLVFSVVLLESLMENDTTKRHQTCHNSSEPARSLLPPVPFTSYCQPSGAARVLEQPVDGDHLCFIPAAQSGPRRNRPRTPDCKHITSRKRSPCRIWSLL